MNPTQERVHIGLSFQNYPLSKTLKAPDHGSIRHDFGSDFANGQLTNIKILSATEVRSKKSRGKHVFERLSKTCFPSMTSESQLCRRSCGSNSLSQTSAEVCDVKVYRVYHFVHTTCDHVVSAGSHDGFDGPLQAFLNVNPLRDSMIETSAYPILRKQRNTM